MNKDIQNKSKIPQKDQKMGPKPNETAGFYFSSAVKISDPNTKEILVQIRGDI